LLLKDVTELSRHPGAIIPPASIGLTTLIPPFLVTIAAPLVAGETLAESDEFTEGASLAVHIIPELQGLDGIALIEAFVFHQFMLLFLMVPVVAALAIAAHAIIGEKLARTLEPLLATPISTMELLIAKMLTPVLFSMAVLYTTLAVFYSGVAVLAEPGVLAALTGTRTAVLFVLISPLLAVTSTLMGVVISSRVNDPRSAQQLAVFVILPITAVFVAQLVGQFVIGLSGLLGAAATLLATDGLLMWVAVRVFDREHILMRWK
jgi:ABC-2 type transport system permease protein